jgi:hypothetical protein
MSQRLQWVFPPFGHDKTGDDGIAWNTFLRKFHAEGRLYPRAVGFDHAPSEEGKNDSRSNCVAQNKGNMKKKRGTVQLPVDLI